ncbi:putative FBD-associated F-box protein At1g61330 [Vicia villosa]|uniref:putative FBD-associated F-box protein At1g61330 n=1 Tax=Vicia villosa TaxID=3911 RepID=UPI00273A8423|nr:putative FBD-associated F-box protein At1g61330 [Vicia villosa]
MVFSGNQNQSRDYVPEDIIQNIFTFLPIKDAIENSSFVSTRHTRSWCYNRRFLFGIDFYLRYNQLKLATIVDHIFNFHKGSEIKIFQLHINPIGIEIFLRRWLEICTKKDLEELELHFYEYGFIIEFSVFNALHHLKALKLVNCVIQLSESPSGLQFLQRLYLCNLHITEDVFNVLIEHCKMLAMIDLIQCSTIKKLILLAKENKHLKKLTIDSCRDLKEIKIDSPTLRSIFYQGNFVEVRIAQGVQLYEAFLNFIPSKNCMQSTQLEAIVNDLSHLSILTTTHLLIEVIVASIRDGVFRDTQYYFVNLRELHLIMDGGIFCNPYDITMFLKICPSLMKLYIDLNDYQLDLKMYWEMHQKHLLDNCSHKFNNLKVVVLRSFKFLPSELDFSKDYFAKSNNFGEFGFLSTKNYRS